MLVILLVPPDELFDPLLEWSRWRIPQLLCSQGDVSVRLENIASWWHGHVISDGLLTEGALDALHEVANCDWVLVAQIDDVAFCLFFR